MTQPQPQQEYIITEEELDEIMQETHDLIGYSCVENIATKIRSRPLPRTNSAEAQPHLDLLPILMYCRNILNTDKSGLSFGLARCKQIAEGYRWIPRGEWGCYDHTERTIETLQKEVGYLIEEIVNVCEQSLRESGERVNVNIREVETAISELHNYQEKSP